MPPQQRDAGEPRSSSARHAIGYEIRNANELWSFDYDDDDPWVCIDEENCGVAMIPCCWKWSDKHDSFMTKAGEPENMPPYFRTDEGHRPDCKASLFVAPRERTAPEYRLGVPTDYPARVKLSRELPGNGKPKLGQTEKAPLEDPNRRRGRTTYSIREACEYYCDHPDQRLRRLRIDGCSGSNYQQCFVRLGTGDRKDIRKNWIFFDQLWLGEFTELWAEPLVLPLLTTAHKEPRSLVVATSHWLPGYRKEIRDRLFAAIRESRKAIREGRPERAWVFFYGLETEFDQTGFNTGLQPGVDVLVRAMPGQWNLRYKNGYRTRRR